MISTISRAIVVAAALSLAACGGGAGGTAVPARPTAQPFQAPTPVPRQFASLTLTVHPSTATTTASDRRSPKYVSINTQSVSFQLVSWNGNAEASAPVVVVGLTGANCTGVGAAKTCTVTSTAPVGTDIFQVTTYSSSDGSGQALSQNNASGTVTGPGPNNLSVSLNAVVNSLGFVPNNATCLDGSPCSGAVTLNAYDPSGALIVGNGLLLTPALAGDSVTSPCAAHLSLTTAAGGTLYPPFANIAGLTAIGKANYDGTSLGVSGGTLTCTATDTGGKTATFTFTTSSSASVNWTIN